MLFHLPAIKRRCSHHCQCSQHEGCPQEWSGSIAGLADAGILIRVVSVDGSSAGAVGSGIPARASGTGISIGAVAPRAARLLLISRSFSRRIFLHRIQRKIRRCQDVSPVSVVVVVDRASRFSVDRFRLVLPESFISSPRALLAVPDLETDAPPSR